MASAQQTLNEIELPVVKGQRVDFWHNGRQFWVQADQTYSWALLRIGDTGGAQRILEFNRRDDGFHVIDDRVGMHPAAVDDWRGLVSSSLY